MQQKTTQTRCSNASTFEGIREQVVERWPFKPGHRGEGQHMWKLGWKFDISGSRSCTDINLKKYSGNSMANVIMLLWYLGTVLQSVWGKISANHLNTSKWVLWVVCFLSYVLQKMCTWPQGIHSGLEHGGWASLFPRVVCCSHPFHISSSLGILSQGE